MGNNNKANSNCQKRILPGKKKLLQYQKSKPCKKNNKRQPRSVMPDIAMH